MKDQNNHKANVVGSGVEGTIGSLHTTLSKASIFFMNGCSLFPRSDPSNSSACLLR